jgi:hypothetical protein
MVVAVIALIAALSGTAVAAGIVPRAKFAMNAGKLQGKTAAQVAALPGPASTAAGLVTVATTPFNLAPGQAAESSVSCSSGKAISGGFSTGSLVLAGDTRPTAEGTWALYLINLSDNAPASGTLHVVCLK